MIFNYTDLIGIPFKDGGRDKNGVDCWGLAKLCFKRQNIKVKDFDISCFNNIRISNELELNKPYWDKLEKPVFGCLVVCNIGCNNSYWANHVGIFVDNQKMLHSYNGVGVCLSSIKRWKNHVIGYYLPQEVNNNKC